MKRLVTSPLLLGSAAVPIAAARSADVSGDIAVTAWDIAARLHEQTRGRNL